ncbi:MAG: tetratricopeptide repeat protein [Bryobacteraceae bacterium]
MSENAPKATYTRKEVLRLLAITERQLRGWERHNLIRHAETFAFNDLIALRTLMKLCESRISITKIKAAISAVRARLRHIEDPLRELKVISEGSRIRVEVNGQQMESLSGQLLFNFDRAELKRLLSFPAAKKSEESQQGKRHSAERCFQQGLEYEQNGAVADAIKAYETAVDLDPGSAGAWLNLGTIFFNARQYSRSEGFYKKALEADPGYALAHFNIANLYDERGNYAKALHHYQRAVELSPGYADAHYNLALLHQGTGQVMDAMRHWTTYLRLDPGSAWGAIARRELDKIRKSTVVPGFRQKSTGTRPVLD